MVTKCANPQCTEAFLYLTFGKLYSIASNCTGKQPLGWRHYWLCEECSKQLTIKPGDGDEIRILPRGEATPVAVRAAAGD